MALRVAVIGVGHLGKHHARILCGSAGRRAGGGGRHQSRARRGDCRRLPDPGRCLHAGDLLGQRRRGDDRGADGDASRCGAAVSGRGRAGAGREADGAFAGRGRRDDRGSRPSQTSPSRWGRPNDSIPPSPRRGRCSAHPRFIEGASPRHVPRAQPGHRRRLRPDDSRSRRRAVAGPFRGRVDRRGRRTGADRAG